jgi:hypothetical protein
VLVVLRCEPRRNHPQSKPAAHGAPCTSSNVGDEGMCCAVLSPLLLRFAKPAATFARLAVAVGEVSGRRDPCFQSPEIKSANRNFVPLKPYFSADILHECKSIDSISQLFARRIRKSRLSHSWAPRKMARLESITIGPWLCGATLWLCDSTSYFVAGQSLSCARPRSCVTGSKFSLPVTAVRPAA